MKGHKTLIALVVKFLQGLWYLNLVLSASAVVFQAWSMLVGKHNYAATFLGSFSIDLNQLATLDYSNGSNVAVLLDDMRGTPSLLFNSPYTAWYALIFSVVVGALVLFYNYHMLSLFKIIDFGVKQSRHFSKELVAKLLFLSKSSLAVFVVLALLSLSKMLLMESITHHLYVFTPVFDTLVLNFLWACIAFYLLAGVFNVALNLQYDQELTV